MKVVVSQRFGDTDMAIAQANRLPAPKQGLRRAVCIDDAAGSIQQRAPRGKLIQRLHIFWGERRPCRRLQTHGRCEAQMALKALQGVKVISTELRLSSLPTDVDDGHETQFGGRQLQAPQVT
ncbi:MAG: hypothetical protein CFE28_10705 [Alphaproteobacteria bacterium PA2]|nr:MAG: hypothetical protein CFE28_10705 [Alphaproteobacteria bacterium PA2]